MSNTNIIIKKLRKQKDITLDYLAQVTGLTKGYLSKIERAASLPPFSTLELIAKALDIDVAHLLERRADTAANPDIEITRKHERTADKTLDSGKNCSFTSLLRYYKGKYMTPILVTFEPGSEREFKHDGEEFVYILRGEIKLAYENEVHDLKADDCFYLDSRKEHRFNNHGVEPAVLLSVTFNYRRF